MSISSWFPWKLARRHKGRLSHAPAVRRRTRLAVEQLEDRAVPSSNAGAGGGYITLDPPASAQTYAYGISGNNVVGSYNQADPRYWPPYGYPHGFLYNGSTGAYATLDFPGALWTEAYDISGNNIVGRYYGLYADAGEHVFLYDGSSYTSLEPPGASPGSTSATGVSGNNVVGSYYGDLDWRYHGYLYDCDRGAFTIIDPPDSRSTGLAGVSGNNVVGNYTDAAGFHFGFLYDGSRYITLDFPKARVPYPWMSTDTYVMGVSGNNVVGWYEEGYGESHGFLYNASNGTWKTLDPHGSSGTQAIAVSGKNVVGTYWDQFGGKHGFLYDGSKYTTLDPPGALETDAFGVSGKNVVGSYQDAEGVAGVRHGFLYVAGGTATLTNSALSCNSAVGASSGSSKYGAPGGGPNVSGKAIITLTQVTLPSSDTAGCSGGGLYASSGSTVTVRDVTVTGNFAQLVKAPKKKQAHGGGLFIDPGATVYLDAFTVAYTIGNTPDNIYGRAVDPACLMRPSPPAT